jgi:hypothetical protein
MPHGRKVGGKKDVWARGGEGREVNESIGGPAPANETTAVWLSAS